MIIVYNILFSTSFEEDNLDSFIVIDQDGDGYSWTIVTDDAHTG